MCVGGILARHDGGGMGWGWSSRRCEGEEGGGMCRRAGESSERETMTNELDKALQGSKPGPFIHIKPNGYIIIGTLKEIDGLKLPELNGCLCTARQPYKWAPPDRIHIHNWGIEI